MKSGFHPLKNAKEKMVNYSNYFLVPGIWIYEDEGCKPVACWATFTPTKELLGTSFKFLDAKEKVKIHKISKFMARRK